MDDNEFCMKGSPSFENNGGMRNLIMQLDDDPTWKENDVIKIGRSACIGYIKWFPTSILIVITIREFSSTEAIRTIIVEKNLL